MSWEHIKKTETITCALDEMLYQKNVQHNITHDLIKLETYQPLLLESSWIEQKNNNTNLQFLQKTRPNSFWKDFLTPGILAHLRRMVTWNPNTFNFGGDYRPFHPLTRRLDP